MIIKRFFPQIVLTIALPCLGMNNNAQPQISEEQQQLLPAKQKITKENFDKAISAIHSRPGGGDYLAEELSKKLQRFINQELTANEWGEEVQKAYFEIIQDVARVAFSLMVLHPIENVFEEILKATFPELFPPNEPEPQV